MEIPTITKVMIEMVSMEILPLSAVVVRGEHEKEIVLQAINILSVFFQTYVYLFGF